MATNNWTDKDRESYKQDVKRYLANPVLMVEELFGIGKCQCRNGEPCIIDPKQIEILQAMFKIMIAKMKKGAGLPHNEEEAKKLGVLAQSAKGTGKTAIAAICTIAFMFLFPECKVFLVGPKEDQIKQALWPEIAKWFSHATKVYGENNILNQMFEMPSESIYCKAFLPTKSIKKEWTTNILTFPKGADEQVQKATIQGKHARYMLFVLEECPAIPDHIMAAVEETCTDLIGINMCLGIFNPNKNTGWAIEGMKDPKSFTGIQISAFDSSLVSRDFIERIERKYGKDSDAYRVSVLGLPPVHSTTGMFPWDWLNTAVERRFYYIPDTDYPAVGAIDIGSGGKNDPTIACIRKGPEVLHFFECPLSEAPKISAWILDLITQYNLQKTVIDKNGIGWGIYEFLSSIDGVVGFLSHEKANEPERYQSMRDEVFVKLREDFETGAIIIPDDTDLKGELSCFTWDTTGIIKVISKKDSNFKKELKAAVGYDSPNKADALAMTYYVDFGPRSKAVLKRPKPFDPFDIFRKKETRHPLSWLV